MESDCCNITTAIEVAPVPDLESQAAVAHSTANFTQNPGVPVGKITGVIKKKKTPVIVTDEDDSGVNVKDHGYDTDNSGAECPRLSSANAIVVMTKVMTKKMASAPKKKKIMRLRSIVSSSLQSIHLVEVYE